MRELTAAGALGVAVALGVSACSVSGQASSTDGSGAAGSDVAQYCELEVTWTTGASMTIAEALNRTLVSSCDDLASDLTQGSQGNFTAVPDGNLPSMPAGICTADGVTLISAPTTAEVACDGLDQAINYLVP
jgi:hypothetical protein